ncbi:MAG: hypothetical protein ACYTG2_12470 [Planctomycetota bacterium]|jgi:hypothetical protein
MKPLLLSLLVLCACSGTPSDRQAPAPEPQALAAPQEVALEPEERETLEALGYIGDGEDAEAAPAAEVIAEGEPSGEVEVAEEVVETAVEEVAAQEAEAQAVEVQAVEVQAVEVQAIAPADGQDAAAQPEVEFPNLTPTDAPQPPAVSIPDIDKHRSESLPYVRKLADFVEVDLGPIDIDADPILIVDGEPISRAVFRRRALMYAGENEIDKHVTRMLTDQQIELQIANGADPKSFEPKEEDVQKKLDELKELVRMQAMQPTGDAAADEEAEARGEAAVQAYLDTIDSSIGMEAYKKLLSADAQFERVFLPMPGEAVEGEKHDFEQGPPPEDDPPPDWLPKASWDALGTDEQGRMLRTFVKTWAIDGTGVPAMFKPNLLAKIRQGLIDTQGLDFFFDADMPDDALMMLGDKMVRTDDLWPLVVPQMVDTDVKLIVREMLTLAAIRKALDAAGNWMDDEQFAAAWKAENDQYVGTLIPLQTMIMFRGYSSIDRYREHFRYRQAYNEWRRESLTDDEVLSHYQGGGRLMFERGTVVVDVMYAPIGELPFNDETLDRRQEELGAAIEAARATGEGWEAAVAERYPPPPARQGMDPNTMQRSQLRLQMAESELSIFLTGYSLADDLFYHAHKGDVYGPWAERCRRHVFGAEANAGAWAVRVRDYSRRSPLPPFDGTNRDLAYQDFLDLHFFYWAQESLKALLPSVSVPSR